MTDSGLGLRGLIGSGGTGLSLNAGREKLLRSINKLIGCEIVAIYDPLRDEFPIDSTYMHCIFKKGILSDINKNSLEFNNGHNIELGHLVGAISIKRYCTSKNVEYANSELRLFEFYTLQENPMCIINIVHRDPIMAYLKASKTGNPMSLQHCRELRQGMRFECYPSDNNIGKLYKGH